MEKLYGVVGFTKKTFSQYIKEVDTNYSFIKKYASRTGKICGYELTDLTDVPYDVLKNQVPELIKESQFEEAILLLLNSLFGGIKMKRVKKEDNAVKFSFVLWLYDQYDLISKLENQYLYLPPDPKLIQAGIRDLDVLGDTNLIDSMAGGDVLKWEAIKRLPYSTIFNKQMKNTIESKINKKLSELNKQKR